MVFFWDDTDCWPLFLLQQLLSKSLSDFVGLQGDMSTQAMLSDCSADARHGECGSPGSTSGESFVRISLKSTGRSSLGRAKAYFQRNMPGSRPSSALSNSTATSGSATTAASEFSCLDWCIFHVSLTIHSQVTAPKASTALGDDEKSSFVPQELSLKKQCTSMWTERNRLLLVLGAPNPNSLTFRAVNACVSGYYRKSPHVVITAAFVIPQTFRMWMDSSQHVSQNSGLQIDGMWFVRVLFYVGTGEGGVAECLDPLLQKKVM